MQVPRFSIAWIMGVTAMVAVAAAIARIDWRNRIIEELQSPVTVKTWTRAGLQLADRRVVLPAGIQALPTKSRALFEVTQRGVELSSSGKVFGLVRVWHWCGNDPVDEHVARVDIGQMLEFLGEAQPVNPVKLPPVDIPPPGGDFTQFGWNNSEFGQICAWCNLIKAYR